MSAVSLLENFIPFPSAFCRLVPLWRRKKGSGMNVGAETVVKADASTVARGTLD